MTIRIALAGNPNCGKTTLFNALTGLRHKVANYPGVTVEKKEGTSTIAGKDLVVVDLPGIYSISAHSIDETIASRALLGQLSGEPVPHLIVSVIDASNLERNLYLTSQLIDLGIPLIVALNMSDVAESRGISIKKEILARLLGVTVVSLSASKNKGIEDLKRAIGDALNSVAISPSVLAWAQESPTYREHALEIGRLETGDRTPESAVLLAGSALIADASQSTKPEVIAALTTTRHALEAEKIDPYSYEATHRYQWINEVVKRSISYQNLDKKYLSDKLDSIIVHRVWGTLIFLLIMTIIFQSIFLWASVPMDYIDGLFSFFGAKAGELIPEGAFKGLIVDGIIPGVGSVVIFVPQIAILFFFLGVLEDSGYLSRAAFLMDKVMRRCGLQGRSFIPLLSSFACAIPGIMSTRSIPSFADRMTTILVAPLMSCSARLPVFTLLIAAFVPQTYFFGFISLQGLVLLAMYLLGVLGAACVSWVLKLLFFRGEPALFVMEMPPFRIPVFRSVFREILDRIVLFLKSAGTIILACSIVLWFLASYPHGKIEESYAGRIGHFMEPAIKPLGFNWEIGVGLLASFAAREVFVSSLATVYNVADSDDTTSESLLSVLKRRKTSGHFTTLTALSLMVFYVFACQCMSTLAVCRRETGSWKWTGLMFLYMTTLAYVMSFLTYQVGSIIIG